MLKIFVGYDNREPVAFDVLRHSIERHASQPVLVIPLEIQRLSEMGMMWRPYERDEAGLMRDVISDAPQSTEFAISRFLVPSLCRSGWAIFMDCDMILMRDIHDILPLLDDSKAVMVVKHNQQPTESEKMDGQVQTAYPMKNWSSFVAWNCDHPANAMLTPAIVNSWRGLDLHQFRWLDVEDIGELPAAWNWLVNVEPQPEDCAVAHFTLGGAWFPTWEPQPNDDLWLAELESMNGNPT